MQLKPRLLVSLCLVLCVSGAWWALASPQGNAAAGGEKPTPSDLKARVGAPAPDFTLLDSKGNKHQLSSLKDKVVVLEWVNQQCPWSVKAQPICKELSERYATRGVVWLGVESTAVRKAEENEQYIRDKQIPYPILMDNDGKVGKMYGARTTPHVYVINKGRLVYSGALNNDQQGQLSKDDARHYVAEALDAVLAGKDVPVAETQPWGCSVKYAKK